MFVFALLVPGLLVVLVGYVIGYELTQALGGSGPVPEVVGWLLGLVLLVVTCQQLWSWRKRVVRRKRVHQK